ncbi:flagellar FliJ family protein [bacterium]|jgi:flagellar export protein FliJ|nr:flagellar FliJ family protein [bacterium]MDB4379811.1 flagellar FliJ family protein [Mariniblastus sp.]
MNQTKKIEKLNKVLDFYKKELDQQKFQLSEKSNLLKKIETTLQIHQAKIKNSLAGLESSNVTISNCLIRKPLIDQLQVELESTQEQLKVAQLDFENQKQIIRKQMSKIDSMEKLIERKLAELVYEETKREHATADERYLNTDFKGTKR